MRKRRFLSRFTGFDVFIIAVVVPLFESGVNEALLQSIKGVSDCVKPAMLCDCDKPSKRQNESA